MHFQKIKLYQNRSFSEVIDTTFTYFRQHFKPLMRVHLRINAPIGLALILITLIAQMGVGFDFQSLFEPESMPSYVRSTDYVLSTIVSSVASGVFYVMLFLVTAVYMHLYEQHASEDGKAEITPSMVWEESKKHFWMSLLAVFLYLLAVGIGLAMIIIPGFYILTRMSLYQSAIVFEFKDSSSALSRSGDLVRENWWFTFGIIVVVGVISYIIVSMVNLPVIIFFAIVSINAIEDPEILSAISPTTFLWITIGSYFLSYLSSVFAYTLSQIASTLLYGKYVEQQEGKGLLQTIDSTVQTETDET